MQKEKIVPIDVAPNTQSAKKYCQIIAKWQMGGTNARSWDSTLARASGLAGAQPGGLPGRQGPPGAGG
jgi:hypothetical protein